MTNLVIINELNIDPLVKLITPRKQAMGDKKLTIKAEVVKLADANFEKEIKFQNWVANPTLLKKLTKNGNCASTFEI